MRSPTPFGPSVRAGWGVVAALAVAGAAAFWLANLLISLTPIAAEYRAGLSIAYVPMLLQALVGGVVLGFVVSFVLTRFPETLLGRSLVVKALVLSLVLLVLVTLVIEVPAKMFTGIGDPLRYLAMATVFNAIRIPALGLVVGLLAEWHARTRGGSPPGD